MEYKYVYLWEEELSDCFLFNLLIFFERTTKIANKKPELHFCVVEAHTGHVVYK